MNPKKAKDFVSKVAEELNLEEDLVKEVLSFYWSKVRSGLSDLKHHTIMVPNLGTFKIRRQKMDEMAKKSEDIIKHSDPTEFKQYAAHAHASNRLAKIVRLRSLIEEELQRKQEVKQLRNEKSTGDLEEQKPNS